jgi:hypothetical protein
MVREGPAQPPPPPKDTDNKSGNRPYPAEKACGGEIILRTPLHRGIFIAGLVGAAALVFVVLAFRQTEVQYEQNDASHGTAGVQQNVR